MGFFHMNHLAVGCPITSASRGMHWPALWVVVRNVVWAPPLRWLVGPRWCPKRQKGWSCGRCRRVGQLTQQNGLKWWISLGRMVDWDIFWAKFSQPTSMAGQPCRDWDSNEILVDSTGDSLQWWPRTIFWVPVPQSKPPCQGVFGRGLTRS